MIAQQELTELESLCERGLYYALMPGEIAKIECLVAQAKAKLQAEDEKYAQLTDQQLQYQYADAWNKLVELACAPFTGPLPEEYFYERDRLEQLAAGLKMEMWRRTRWTSAAQST